MKKYDVAIIGGGASGLAAAIELGIKAPDLNLVVLEKNDGLGRKIRATGSGRCNISNTAADGYIEIMEFFHRIGLMTKAYDNGLVYPYSESAADVVDLLTAKVHELGAEVLDNSTVISVEKEADQFIVSYEAKGNSRRASIAADNVILALGGKAGPTYGTTGDGYAIARSLGHSTIAPIPVLTSVECAEWNDGALALAGTRTRCKLSLYEDETEEFAEDSLRFRENGELQFTKFGISGICVFNMTRYMRYKRAEGETMSRFLVRVDLFPDGDIREYLRDRRVGTFSGEKVADVLCSVLKKNIADYVLANADRKRGKSLLDRAIASLTDADIEIIAASVHLLEFHPSGVSGWKEAQATSGGVKLDELDVATYESKICSGLYITGELLDYDGPCGGFNLSNAWLSGLHAAAALAE